MNDSARPDCEALLSQVDWVHALARQLTADAHAADDLAQDALAAAWSSGPPRGSLRSWLAALVRNLARHERRSAGHRNARELAVARRDVDLSQEHLLERLDTHRAVVEAVARLDEPYRSAILLRYFEGLSPAAIAARTKTPLRTVHTRLHRALARLRSELDRAHGGDRRTWLLALIPFARGSEGWSAAAIGALFVEAKLKVALVAMVAVGACSTWMWWPEPAQVGEAPATVDVASVIASQPATAVEDELDAREVVERVAPAPAQVVDAPAKPIAPSAVLVGRVIDLDRAPVANVAVRFFERDGRATEGSAARTDAAGAFELADPKSHGYLDIESATWATAYRPEFTGEMRPRELVIVVAPTIALAGVVVDEQRRPVEAAQVVLALPFGLRARFDTVLDSSSNVEYAATTDIAGRFELARVPRIAGAELRATHAAHLPAQTAQPEHDDLALEIVLRSADLDPDQLVGRVVDLAGNPVEGAWVGLGIASSKSGAQGEFALPIAEGLSGDAPDGRERSAAIVRAVKQGYLPAELARADDGVWPDPLVLRLGEPPLSIRGRVVDASDRPVANALVWTSDETRFGFIEIENGEMSMRAGASVEGILRGDPWTRRIAADAEGRFEITGLVPRDYRVVAFEPRALRVVSALVAAGARDVELTLPDEQLHERVAGRVTNLAGAPLASVRVTVARELDGGTSSPFDRLESRAAVTDADGRFEFKNVSRAINLVRVSGEELAFDYAGFPISAGDDVGAIELAVAMRVHVQVDGGAQPDFDRVALLDARGEKLSAWVQHGQSAYSMQDIALEGTRTEAFSVPESAVTLVVSKGAVEVRRMPVKLVPGELNTLRP